VTPHPATTPASTPTRSPLANLARLARRPLLMDAGLSPARSLAARLASPPRPLASSSPRARTTAAATRSRTTVSIDVRAATGVFTLTAVPRALTWEIPDGTDRTTVDPLLTAAAALLAPSEAQQTKAAEAVIKWLGSFMAWCGNPAAGCNGALLCAYVIARCCPPVGITLPDLWPPSPILPTSASSELSVLKRAVRCKMAAARPYADAVDDARLCALRRAIGANVTRLQSTKKPLLWHLVVAYVEPALRDAETWLDKAGAAPPTLELLRDVRDAAAVLTACCFGTRVNELVSLLGADVQFVDVDGREVLEIVFINTKTRQSVFRTHQPFRSIATHTLLLRAMGLFDRVCGWQQEGPVFLQYRGDAARTDAAGRAWFAALIKKIDPECSPHSCRVTLATELWSAGATQDEIQAAGRWTSPAAVIYIIGSLDRKLAAADKFGKGALRYEAGRLREKGVGGNLARPARAMMRGWHAARARA
jgi:integrase